MVKKILLTVGTLIVLLGGYLVLMQFAGQENPRAGIGADPGFDDDDDEGHGTLGGLKVGPAYNLSMYATDPKTGRHTGYYRAEKYQQTGSRMVLTKPHIELYRKEGQTLYIKADTGWLAGTQIGDNFNPRRGRLEGNVVICIDRNATRRADSATPAEEDSITIDIDEVDFDNDELEITSDSKVTLVSKELRVLGEGLLLQWNSDPWELRRLRLAKGEKLEIYAGRDSFTSMLPGAGGPGRTKAATRPAPPAPTTAPLGDPSRSAKKRMQFYTIELRDNVHFASGEQWMKNGESLTWSFTYQSSRDRDDGTAAEPAEPAEPATQPATQPADRGEPMVITWTGPMEMLPYAPEVMGRPPPSPGEFHLAARGRDLRLGDRRTEVRCGQFAYDSLTEAGHLRAEAGRPVLLTIDDGSRVSGRDIRFDRKREQVNIDGPGEMLISRDLAGATTRPTTRPGTRIVGRPPRRPTTAPAEEPAPTRRVTWAEGVELTYGRLGRDAAGGQDKQYPKLAVFRGDVHFDEGDGRTMRGDTIEVTFDPPVLIPRGPTAPPKGKRKYTSARLSRVLAVGSVELTEPPKTKGEEGNYIHTDRLETHMGTTAAGKPYPTRALATGHVRARQDSNVITTEALTVEFTASSPEAIAAGRRPYEPTLLQADNGVTLTDTRPDVRMEIVGDSLTSHPKQRTATVAGSPARVTYGDELLTAPKIDLFFDERTIDGVKKRRLAEAVIPSEGGVRAMTTRDISGRQLAKPRPALIRWAKSMRYLAAKDQLVFEEGVKFDSADGLAADPMGEPIPFDSIGEHLRCGKMTVTLAKPEPPATRPAKAAGRPPKPAPATRPAGRTGVAEMKRRKIQQIVAERNVKVMSRWNDALGYLEGQLQISGKDTLTFNSPGKRLDVDGPGTLLVGDYRPPEPPKARTDAALPEAPNIGRPSQTVFKWGGNMKMSQADWTVDFDGGVVMRHRSGKSILLSGNLPIRNFSAAGPGRQLILDCRHLVARFVKKPQSPAGAKPPAGAKGSPAAKGTPAAESRPTRFENPGLTLDMFVAEGGLAEAAGPNDPAAGSVLFQDGPYMALGKRIEYSRKLDRVIIYGDPARKIDARVYVEDPDAGTSRWHVGEKITVARRAGKIFVTTGPGTGGGSGRK